MKLIVGIDFGTSTTVVRYRMEDSEIIQSLKDANGTSDIIPTVIFRNSDYDTTEYGVQALTSATSAVNGETIANFKMDLLDPEKREHAKELIEEYKKSGKKKKFKSRASQVLSKDQKTVHKQVAAVGGRSIMCGNYCVL